MEIDIITDIKNTKAIHPTIKSKLDIDKLKDNLRNFCKEISSVIPNEPFNSFNLSEISLTVEVSAEGGISLIGTTKVAASSAIQLKFTKIGE